MMPPFRVAQLAPDQLDALQGLESSLGVALVAYESEETTDHSAASSAEAERFVLDGLLDTYRTFDPHV